MISDEAWGKKPEEAFLRVSENLRDPLKPGVQSGNISVFEPMVYRRPPPEYSERERTLIAMHTQACDVYVGELEPREGKDIRSYLEPTGLEPATVREFGVGASDPDSRKLVEELKSYGPELMRASRLFSEIKVRPKTSSRAG
jgi:DNA primase